MAAPHAHPKLGDTAVVAQPFKMSRHPFRVRMAPPEVGEHTDAIMQELGYSAAEIAAFKDKIVI
jgi:formyl-CoA transferase